ncbi:hypothetical protein DITRI_Ditri15bG0053000 [Diplodiscus trichospermus]
MGDNNLGSLHGKAYEGDCCGSATVHPAGHIVDDGRAPWRILLVWCCYSPISSCNVTGFCLLLMFPSFDSYVKTQDYLMCLWHIDLNICYKFKYCGLRKEEQNHDRYRFMTGFAGGLETLCGQAYGAMQYQKAKTLKLQWLLRNTQCGSYLHYLPVPFFNHKFVISNLEA